MRKLFILGHPSEYAGAGSELRHQVILWHLAFPDIKLHIIPTSQGWKNEPLYEEMIAMDISYENPMDFSNVKQEDALINFCSSQFLENLDKIYEKTKRILWVNCMTWLFDLEKKNAAKNYIKFYLYQRQEVRDDHKFHLERLGSDKNYCEFIHFVPYFHADKVDYLVNNSEEVNIGRISRSDADKFSKDTVKIYNGILSSKKKVGHFLGWEEKIINKIGQIPSWIATYKNQNVLPVKRFYNIVDFIVQPTDTTENLPRIGFEAMHSGCPLVVDNKGGWKHMIDHGVSGFLCNSPEDFMYYGSRLAYDFELRTTISENAKKKVLELSSFEKSKESWKQIFEKVYA